MARKWLVSVQEFRDAHGRRVFKVTGRIPELHVAETRFVRSRKKLEELVRKWLL